MHEQEQEKNMQLKAAIIENEQSCNVEGCKHEIVKIRVTEDIKMGAYESDEQEEEDEEPENEMRHMYRSICALEATCTWDEIVALAKKHEDDDVEMKVEQSE